jgi:hypothetical protein
MSHSSSNAASAFSESAQFPATANAIAELQSLLQDLQSATSALQDFERMRRRRLQALLPARRGPLRREPSTVLLCVSDSFSIPSPALAIVEFQRHLNDLISATQVLGKGWKSRAGSERPNCRRPGTSGSGRRGRRLVVCLRRNRIRKVFDSRGRIAKGTMSCFKRPSKTGSSERHLQILSPARRQRHSKVSLRERRQRAALSLRCLELLLVFGEIFKQFSCLWNSYRSRELEYRTGCSW